MNDFKDVNRVMDFVKKCWILCVVALSKLDVTTRKFSMKSSLRIVYAGTSSVALPALRCIKTSQHTLVGVLAKRVPADLCSTDLNNVISVQAQNWQIPVIEAPILRPLKAVRNPRSRGTS